MQAALPAGAVGATGVVPTDEMIAVEKTQGEPIAPATGSSTSTLADNAGNRDEHVDVKRAEAEFEVRRAAFVT